jgi:hypothetical protein
MNQLAVQPHRLKEVEKVTFERSHQGQVLVPLMLTGLKSIPLKSFELKINCFNYKGGSEPGFSWKLAY